MSDPSAPARSGGFVIARKRCGRHGVLQNPAESSR